MSTRKLRMTLDVEYTLNGEEIDSLQRRLESALLRAVGDGLLTGDGPAEVEGYATRMVKVYARPGEEELAGFFRDQLESGNLAAEDIPSRLARYGLEEPAAFVEEMRERMHLEDGDSEDGDGNDNTNRSRA